MVSERDLSTALEMTYWGEIEMILSGLCITCVDFPTHSIMLSDELIALCVLDVAL